MSLFKKKVPEATSAISGLDDRAVGPKSAQDAPWLRAGYQHNDTFLRLAAQAANWRLFAFFAIGVATLAVGGIVYIGSQSKYIPMLVEVDKLGQTLAVRALTGNDAVTDSSRSVYREIFDVVENLRTVTTDRLANNDRMTKGFSRLSGAARSYVRAELKKAPPNEVGTTKSVQVIVKTALKMAGKSWQVDWEEHSFALNGDAIGVELWRANLQYDLLPSDDVKVIRVNPIGFTVSDISWQKVI
jgi:type IV secretion system protein TrbF